MREGPHASTIQEYPNVKIFTQCNCDNRAVIKFKTKTAKSKHTQKTEHIYKGGDLTCPPC